MRLTSRVVAVAILPVLLLGRSPGQSPTASNPQRQTFDTLVIEGGTLIDGNGGTPVRDVLIIIQGNRIKTVTQKGQAVYPSGARVVRADGKFIVPGLMDAHVHYASGCRSSFWRMV